jgi:hypothetical protein
MTRSLVLGLALALLLLPGCRSRHASHSSPAARAYAPPRNALQAAWRWAGARTDLLDAEGHVQLRLRQRRDGFKVLDQHLSPVGYVRHRADHVLLEGVNRRPIYRIEPSTAPSGARSFSVYGVSLPSPAPPDPDHRHRLRNPPPPLERGPLIVTLVLQSDEIWSLRYPPGAVGTLPAQLRVRREGEGWVVEGDRLPGPVQVNASQGEGARAVTATVSEGEELLRVRSATLSPGALAGALDAELPSLVRAGLLSLLQRELAAPPSEG